MRTIKFRAWDLKSQAFKNIQYIEFWEGGMQVALWDGLLVDVRENAEDMVLMQFTGLHDKNGKEIYEGDIVKTEHGATGVMKFHDVSAQYNYNCKEPMWSHPIYSMSGDKEVIGNIYENPELLTNALQQK